MTAGGTDGWLASYSSTGEHRWSIRLGGPLDDQIWDLAVTGDGELIVTGNFNGTVDVGCGPMVSAERDAFLLKMSPHGQ